jgi:ABC-type transport system involved in multi-copper enzyme maturation permease subunit
MAVMTVARVVALRAVRRPSTWALGALTFLPALVGLVMGLQGLGVASTVGPLALTVLGPLLVIALVASPVGEGYEQRTVVYWFTRPMGRPAVVLGELVGYGAVSALALFLAGTLLAMVNATVGRGDLSTLVRVPLGMALEGVVLAAMVQGLATRFPRWPVAAAIGALLLTELALPRLWAPLMYTSLTWHVGTLSGLITEVPASLIGRVDPPAALASALCLAVYAGAPLLAAVQHVSDRDLA